MLSVTSLSVDMSPCWRWAVGPSWGSAEWRLSRGWPPSRSPSWFCPLQRAGGKGWAGQADGDCKLIKERHCSSTARWCHCCSHLNHNGDGSSSVPQRSSVLWILFVQSLLSPGQGKMLIKLNRLYRIFMGSRRDSELTLCLVLPRWHRSNQIMMCCDSQFLCCSHEPAKRPYPSRGLWLCPHPQEHNTSISVQPLPARYPGLCSLGSSCPALVEVPSTGQS